MAQKTELGVEKVVTETELEWEDKVAFQSHLLFGFRWVTSSWWLCLVFFLALWEDFARPTHDRLTIGG